jgi:hypothetical protein
VKRLDPRVREEVAELSLRLVDLSPLGQGAPPVLR